MKPHSFLKATLFGSLTVVSLGTFITTAVFAQQCIQVPVGCQVTSAFGSRYNPITKGFSTEFHHGVDFGCPIGTPVVAAEAGMVSVSGFSVSAGNWVVTNSNGGHLVYKYMHHVRNSVSGGSMVGAGQQLAFTGSTGRSTGPHLHFQVEMDRVAVDPVSRFCSKPPLKPGVLQGADVPVGDVLDAGSQASAPEGGIAPAMGLDGSLDEIMTDVIASRALNPDYPKQLATLSEPRLYAELAYMQSIRLKTQHERSLHKERMLATQAMIQLLMTEMALRPQMDAQRAAATRK